MEKPLLLSLHFPLGYVLAITAGALFLYVSLGYLVARVRKRADIADVAWGFGFVLVAWLSFFLGQSTGYGLIVNFLVTLWALRLGLHIYLRNRRREEDFRYQPLKNQLFTQVFLLQGCILFVVALPIVWIHTHTQPFPEISLKIALPIWAGGFFLETLADWQLAMFQKNPLNKGKLCMSGLWSFVRHPNYLGELMQWWAIWVMGAFLPFGGALLISPLLLTYLIVKVSGVKPLEEKMKQHPDFKKYQESTPSLISAPFVNGLLYGITWFILIFLGSKGFLILPLLVALGGYAVQIAWLAKGGGKAVAVSLLLSALSLGLGLMQELLFIQWGALAYPDHPFFPPLWLLALYPLFALTLNSSLSFLNQNLFLAFFLGGVGGVLSYLSGETFGAVHLFPPRAYPILFISWGLFLTLLLLVNRKLGQFLKAT